MGEAALPGVAAIRESGWVSPISGELYCRAWQPIAPHDGAGVYLLHGLGEHVGRYDALAAFLCQRGWHVASHDHHGHGRSAGRRGTMPRAQALTDDATELVASFERMLGRPPIVLGHSLGGALAAELVVVRGVPARGLVLSSPALDPGMNPVQKLLLALMERLAPGLAIGNGLDPQRISHDAGVVAAYRDDPLVHDRVSARVVRWLVDAGLASVRRAGALETDVLLLVSGADTLVDPLAARRFADAAPPSRTTLHWHDEAWHELFNEIEPIRRHAYEQLGAWLDTRR
ncbi:MAG: lysophospholipase [Burkholderiaceae bacterium]|nr:lysophospholipase [Burkholderiaceae bacterium]